MRLSMLPAAFLLLLLPAMAAADPVGDYAIRGAGPDAADSYEGTVRITRKGELYSVVWTIGDTTISGTAIGGRRDGAGIKFGPAGPADIALSVTYRSGDTSGTAVYVEEASGRWQGTWAYEGADRLSTEIWTEPSVEEAATLRSLTTDTPRSAPVPDLQGPNNR